MQRIRPKPILFALLLLILAAQSYALEEVRLQLKWYHQFQFAGYYAAAEKGYYREEGLDVTIIEGKLGLYPLERIVSGEVQYGVAGPEALLKRLKGDPLVVLAVVFQHSPRVVIVKKGSGINSPQDLVEQGIWMGLGIKNYPEIHAMLLKEGISADKLTNIGRWTVERFARSNANVFAGHITVQPYQLRKAGVSISIIRPSTYGIDFYGDSLITSESELANHPERVRRFRRASLRGWNYAMQHPEEMIELILDRYQSTRQEKTREELLAEAESMKELILPTLVDIGHINKGRWQHIAEVYADLGMIEKKASLEGFIFDPDPTVDPTRLYWIIALILIFSGLVVSIALGLATFNRRLQKEIRGRRNVEKELLKRSQALEQSDSTIVITNIDGTIEYVNPAFTRITGYAREEAIGQNPRILKSGRQPTSFYREMWQSLLKGETWRGEMINRKKNGDLYWELVTISPVKNADGEKTHYVAVKEDITARKQMEEDLQQAKQQAEAANEAKSGFLANMSHELRTPLNGIIGFSQILERQILSKLNEKQQGYFQIIKDSGNHLLQMINDVLDLSKIEAGKTELEKKPFDLGKMVIRSPSIIRDIAARKHIQIATDVPTDLGWINGDETKLKQVIYNLLSNAVKFTDSGKWIGIGASYQGDDFTITVWDEGIGIPAEHLNRVFIPFEQVKGIQSSNERGTGLGLAISRHLVELHDGSISVSSEVGKGARFTISLPGRIPMNRSVTDETEPAANGGNTLRENPLRILLTEDSPNNIELIEAALETDLLDVAQSGEEAVRMAAEREYDIILMDIQLPGINGTEAMQQIRKRQERQIPILALTAFAMEGDREKYLERGFDDYVSKPVDLDDLTRRILELTRRPPSFPKKHSTR